MSNGIPTTRADVERCAAEWAADGPRKTFTVLDTPSQKSVGTLTVTLDAEFLAKRQAEIGYGFIPPWDEGETPGRAVVLACRYLARNDLADEAVLRIGTENKPDIALARRLGFQYHHSSVGPEGTVDWFLQAL